MAFSFWKMKKKNRLTTQPRSFFFYLMRFWVFILICALIYLSWYFLKKEYIAQMSSPIQLMFLGQNKITQDRDIEQLIAAESSLDYDIDSLKSLMLTLPWVREVHLVKKWPNTFTISVDEFEPKYRWQTHFYLDKEGNSFSMPEGWKTNATFVEIYGVEGSEKQCADYVDQFEDIIDKWHSKQIKLTLLMASMNARGSWQLLMEYCTNPQLCHHSKMMVYLGNENVLTRFENLIEYLPEVIKKLGLKDRIVSVDLRNESGIMVETESIER